MSTGSRSGRGKDAGDDGFSVVVSMLGLVVTALLVALLLGSALHSGGTAGTGVSRAPQVARADAVQAQQTLATALSTAVAAATAAGGYGSLTAAGLSSADPGVTFVAGPSSDPSTVSVAITTAGPGGVPGGSITLADRSPDGTCWLVWRGDGAGTWYGAQTALAACMAPTVTSVPDPGPVSSARIGWQQAGFPAL
jgi:hypothetical protein